MANKLEDYPPGVQDLLKQAGYHLEQLDLLEREFRAWQAAQVEGPTPYIKALPLPSYAEQARLRWEAKVRALGQGGVTWPQD